MTILFCNTGWMNFYDGNTAEDEIDGEASFIKEYRTGGEIYNFSKSFDKYYGFVMSQGRIGIEKLGASTTDDYIDNVLVVWLSTHPEEGKVRVVGWYKHARVYRERQEPVWGTARYQEDYSYNIEANVKDCTLIPSMERTFIIPRATKNTGGIGRSSVWYCDGMKNELIREEVLDYIKSYDELSKQKGGNSSGNINTVTKLQVESNAINMVQNHFEREGFTVISVERDNVGWDLEARSGLLKLKLEVKGLSGEDVLVHLTPNEYENMKKYNESYKLCIVTKALDPQSIKLHIFSYDDVWNVWRDDCGNTLNIEERVSAKMSI